MSQPPIMTDTTTDQPQTPKTQEELPPRQGWRRALESLFIPGLGQFNQGRYFMAISLFLLAAFFWYKLWIGWAIHLWAAVDAEDGEPEYYLEEDEEEETQGDPSLNPGPTP